MYGDSHMILSKIRLLLCFSLLAMPLVGCAWFEEDKPSPILPDMPGSMAKGGGESFSTSAPLSGSIGARTMYNGEEVSSINASGLNSGMVFPDGDGGVVILEGEKFQKQNPGHVDARELKLKIRELAEQLIAGIRDDSLKGAVALPVSFVNLDDMNQSSSFGRYVAEQLFYEFNQRGFPVREYRIPGNISLREKEGEFYLSRALGEMGVATSGTVIVAGTYYYDPQAVFVNARLLRPSDGRVLRTANMVLQNNSLTRRMLSSSVRMEAGQMRIRDYQETVAPRALSPIDIGSDIH